MPTKPSQTPSETTSLTKRTRTPKTPVPAVSVDPSGARDAAWLADLFTSQTIFDIYQASAYLGIDRPAVEYAVARGRLACVQVRSKKLFAVADLDAYRARRGPGRSSRLGQETVYEVS